MNQKQAIKTLTRLAAERKAAHKSSMDWKPDVYTHDDITEARHVLAKSKKSASELLSKEAYNLFENEAYGRFPVKS